MGVMINVLMQLIHERPTPVFAKHLKPAGNIKKARSGGIRIGHCDVSLVDRLGQILPGGRHWQVVLVRFDGIYTDCGHPGVHSRPGRRIGFIAEL